MAVPSLPATQSQDIPSCLPNTTSLNLLSLPRELRDEIYRLCLAPEATISPRFHFTNKPIFVLPNAHGLRPKILLVSRQIRAEVLPLFYQINTFHFIDIQLAKLFFHSLAEQDLLRHLQDVNIFAKSTAYNLESTTVVCSKSQRGIKVFAQSIKQQYEDQGLCDAVKVQVCILHAPMPVPEPKSRLDVSPDERMYRRRLGCTRLMFRLDAPVLKDLDTHFGMTTFPHDVRMVTIAELEDWELQNDFDVRAPQHDDGRRMRDAQ